MSTHIPAELRRQVRRDAGERCGYCLSSERLLGIALEVEHTVPESAGGETQRDNLWLACRRCNSFKADRWSVGNAARTSGASNAKFVPLRYRPGTCRGLRP